MTTLQFPDVLDPASGVPTPPPTYIQRIVGLVNALREERRGKLVTIEDRTTLDNAVILAASILAADLDTSIPVAGTGDVQASDARAFLNSVPAAQKDTALDAAAARFADSSSQEDKDKFLFGSAAQEKKQKQLESIPVFTERDARVWIEDIVDDIALSIPGLSDAELARATLYVSQNLLTNLEVGPDGFIREVPRFIFPDIASTNPGVSDEIKLAIKTSGVGALADATILTRPNKLKKGVRIAHNLGLITARQVVILDPRFEGEVSAEELEEATRWTAQLDDEITRYERLVRNEEETPTLTTAGGIAKKRTFSEIMLSEMDNMIGKNSSSATPPKILPFFDDPGAARAEAVAKADFEALGKGNTAAVKKVIQQGSAGVTAFGERLTTPIAVTTPLLETALKTTEQIIQDQYALFLASLPPELPDVEKGRQGAEWLQSWFDVPGRPIVGAGGEVTTQPGQSIYARVLLEQQENEQRALLSTDTGLTNFFADRGVDTSTLGTKQKATLLRSIRGKTFAEAEKIYRQTFGELSSQTAEQERKDFTFKMAETEFDHWYRSQGLDPESLDPNVLTNWEMRTFQSGGIDNLLASQAPWLGTAALVSRPPVEILLGKIDADSGVAKRDKATKASAKEITDIKQNQPELEKLVKGWLFSGGATWDSILVEDFDRLVSYVAGLANPFSAEQSVTNSAQNFQQSKINAEAMDQQREMFVKAGGSKDIFDALFLGKQEGFGITPAGDIAPMPVWRGYAPTLGRGVGRGAPGEGDIELEVGGASAMPTGGVTPFFKPVPGQTLDDAMGSLTEQFGSSFPRRPTVDEEGNIIPIEPEPFSDVSDIGPFGLTREQLAEQTASNAAADARQLVISQKRADVLDLPSFGLQSVEKLEELLSSRSKDISEADRDKTLASVREQQLTRIRKQDAALRQAQQLPAPMGFEGMAPFIRQAAGDDLGFEQFGFEALPEIGSKFRTEQERLSRLAVPIGPGGLPEPAKPLGFDTFFERQALPELRRDFPTSQIALQSELNRPRREEAERRRRLRGRGRTVVRR